MAKKAVAPVVVEETTESERNSFVEMARKVLMAGIGAVALAQDEAETFINKLVERGEIAEKDARKLIDELVDRRKTDAKKAETEIDKRVEDLLGRMSVPTKADIDALSAKITALTEKVEQLKKGA